MNRPLRNQRSNVAAKQQPKPFISSGFENNFTGTNVPAVVPAPELAPKQEEEQVIHLGGI